MEIKTTKEINRLSHFQNNKRWIAYDDLMLQLEDWNNNEGLCLFEVIEQLKPQS